MMVDNFSRQAAVSDGLRWLLVRPYRSQSNIANMLLPIDSHGDSGQLLLLLPTRARSISDEETGLP